MERSAGVCDVCNWNWWWRSQCFFSTLNFLRAQLSQSRCGGLRGFLEYRAERSLEIEPDLTACIFIETNVKIRG